MAIPEKSVFDVLEDDAHIRNTFDRFNTWVDHEKKRPPHKQLDGIFNRIKDVFDAYERLTNTEDYIDPIDLRLQFASGLEVTAKRLYMEDLEEPSFINSGFELVCKPIHPTSYNNLFNWVKQQPVTDCPIEDISLRIYHSHGKGDIKGEVTWSKVGGSNKAEPQESNIWISSDAKNFPSDIAKNIQGYINSELVEVCKLDLSQKQSTLLDISAFPIRPTQV